MDARHARDALRESEIASYRKFWAIMQTPSFDLRDQHKRLWLLKLICVNPAHLEVSNRIGIVLKKLYTYFLIYQIIILYYLNITYLIFEVLKRVAKDDSSKICRHNFYCKHALYLSVSVKFWYNLIIVLAYLHY